MTRDPLFILAAIACFAAVARSVASPVSASASSGWASISLSRSASV